MAIGREPLKKVFRVPESKWKTVITKIEPNEVKTRGYSQKDLITNLNYSEMLYLTIKGELPSKKESEILNYILVSFCDHGVTPPSTQTARLVSSSGSPLNVALSSALLSLGKNHAGAIEEAMKLFQSSIINLKISPNFDIDNIDNLIDEVANQIVDEALKNEMKIPGYGHRYHKKDPRADKLLDIAFSKKFIGPHTKLALAIDKILFNEKKININVDGANAGLLSDLGFDNSIGIGIFIIGRLPGLIAHCFEENEEEKNFRKFCHLDDVSYCGEENKNFNEEK